MESSFLIHGLPVSLQWNLTLENWICSVLHLVQPLPYCTFLWGSHDFCYILISVEGGMERMGRKPTNKQTQNEQTKHPILINMTDFVASQLDACALAQVCSCNDGLNVYVKFAVVVYSI